jgi:hypothetical protein
MRIKLSELKHGPIGQEILPEGFIDRVQKYKAMLKEVETSSVEETVSNFQRDLHPERELLIWESITHCYQADIIKNPKWSLAQKKKRFQELLTATLR